MTMEMLTKEYGCLTADNVQQAAIIPSIGAMQLTGVLLLAQADSWLHHSQIRR